jgi:L-ascorbate metabolism protein UlaG (beta-lactamase superfamily)
MRIRWFGHAAFELDGRDRVLIDPFLDGNPVSPVKSADVSADIIIPTHGHNDHLGDTVSIAKRTGATVVATWELAKFCEKRGCKVDPMNVGSINIRDSRISLTHAVHSGGCLEGEEMFYTGNPCGAVVDSGKKVYHAGDTWLFNDMTLIGEFHRPEAALLPIGGRFTMGPSEAAVAAMWINPKLVVPMHYNTFDLIKSDPQEFKRRLEDASSIEVVVMKPGDTIDA